MTRMTKGFKRLNHAFPCVNASHMNLVRSPGAGITRPAGGVEQRQHPACTKCPQQKATISGHIQRVPLSTTCKKPHQ